VVQYLPYVTYTYILASGKHPKLSKLHDHVKYSPKRHLCEPARQPDLLQCYALVEDSVGTDDLHHQLLWNVELESQQLLHVTDARTNRTPNKLGLQRRKLIVVKHISRQTTKSTVYTIMAVYDNKALASASVLYQRLPAAEAWSKCSNALSFSSPAVNEERMRTVGDMLWLGSVLCGVSSVT